MNHHPKSIRPFLGAKDYTVSRNFYRDLGFKEVVLSSELSYFDSEGFGFYLQNAYVKDWVDNTMVFMEVSDLKQFWDDLMKLDLNTKYPGVRLVPIHEQEWGSECFVHDPSGILWHFGAFKPTQS